MTKKISNITVNGYIVKNKIVEPEIFAPENSDKVEDELFQAILDSVFSILKKEFNPDKKKVYYFSIDSFDWLEVQKKITNISGMYCNKQVYREIPSIKQVKITKTVAGKPTRILYPYGEDYNPKVFKAVIAMLEKQDLKAMDAGGDVDSDTPIIETDNDDSNDYVVSEDEDND